MTKTAQVKTPQSKDDPDDVAVEEIPLPPEEMWADLDNSAAGAARKPLPEAASTASGAQTRPLREIADLDFAVDIFRTVELDFPFRLDGKVINAIRVRRLSVGEVGQLLDELPVGRPDNFDIYAAMTGHPAPVLRGLIDQDGQAVAEACFDFLPRVFRPLPKTDGEPEAADPSS